MNIKQLPALAHYLLGVFSVLLVLLGLGIYGLLKNQRSEVVSAPLTQTLNENVKRHEKEAGWRCDDIHQGAYEMIANELSPLLDNYKTGGDWKAKLDDRARRIVQFGALAEACVALQRNLIQRGTNVRKPISQNFMIEVSSLPVYVGNRLTSETCGPTCVSTHMNLIEASRDSLAKELQQAPPK